MALQVWLPLNGNMENQGLANVTITESGGSATYADGKIGLGLSTSSKFWVIRNITLGSEATIAYWSKTTVASKMVWVLECNVSNYLNIYESSFYTLNTGDSNNNPFKYNGSNVSVLNDGLWHHFAVTFGNSVAKLYIDGEYRGTALTFRSPATTNKPIKLAGGFNNAHSYDWNGMINDFRVYDNCLSAKEVRDLSLGLILHYKLDGNSIPNDITFYDYIQSDTASYIDTGINPKIKPRVVAELCMLNTSDKDYWGNSSINGSAYYANFANRNLTYYRYGSTTSQNVNAYVDLNTWHIWDVSKEVYLDGELKFTSNNTYTYNANQANIYIFKAARSNYFSSYKLRSFELYDGDELVRNFIPASSGSTPGLFDTIEAKFYINKGTGSLTLGNQLSDFFFTSDCSGYLNNGDINNTLSTSNDSPRYSKSTTFNGSSYIQLTSPSVEVKTISFWAKWSSIPSGQSVLFVDQKSKIGFGLMSTGILCSSGSVQTKVFNKTVIKANQWYHFVIVNNGTGSTDTTRDLYINSEKQTPLTATNSWTYALDYLQIGKRSTSSDGFNGQMSDFRMYTTQLSDEMILELYNTSAYICDNDSIGAYEFNEELGWWDDGSLMVSGVDVEKNGIIRSDDFTETSGSTTFGDSYVLSEEFVEI